MEMMKKMIHHKYNWRHINVFHAASHVVQKLVTHIYKYILDYSIVLTPLIINYYWKRVNIMESKGLHISISRAILLIGNSL